MDQYLRLRTKDPGQRIWSIHQRRATCRTSTGIPAQPSLHVRQCLIRVHSAAEGRSGIRRCSLPACYGLIHRIARRRTWVAATILSVSVMLSLVPMSLRGGDDHSRSPTEERVDTQPCSMNAPPVPEWASIRPSLWQRIRQPLPRWRERQAGPFGLSGRFAAELIWIRSAHKRQSRSGEPALESTRGKSHRITESYRVSERPMRSHSHVIH